MQRTLERLLDSPRTVYAASACSLALGLFFIFVWSPLPWGWLGIDFYHDRALGLAAGQGFDTTDVPWGYAYFVAAFYALFGNRPWIPLVAQALLNMLVPILLWRLARPFVGPRAAVLAALLTGIFSFNTIYTSTQSTDSVSTVLFLASLLAFVQGLRHGRWLPFAVSGLVAGVVAQFRPNLILFPAFAAAAYLVEKPRERQKLLSMVVYLGMVATLLMPWIVRNYRLTHAFVPTSTHGGHQLWYGTLQVGPYLESRADNPRSEFEGGTFDYTSIDTLPLVVSASRALCNGVWAEVTLTYWTDRDKMPRRVAGSPAAANLATFEVPAQPSPTVLYYFLEAAWPGSPAPVTSPRKGARSPFVFFVSNDHLGDLDRRDDLLDTFDLIRLLRALAWKEGSISASTPDLDGDGLVSEGDIRRAARLLLESMGRRLNDPVAGIAWDAQAVRLTFEDRSVFTVPRTWSGRLTDLTAEGDLARVLLHARRSRASLGDPPDPVLDCAGPEWSAVNDVFYRREIHSLRRYMVLAWDNIKRDPWAYATSVVYRAVRLFIIQGSDQYQRAQQFAGSRVVYAVGAALSWAYLFVFLGGLGVAWRRRARLWPLILPVVYVPLTISFLLTNMRYTITVQPLMFVFAAVALLQLARIETDTRARGEGPL